MNALQRTRINEHQAGGVKVTRVYVEHVQYKPTACVAKLVVKLSLHSCNLNLGYVEVLNWCSRTPS